MYNLCPGYDMKQPAGNVFGTISVIGKVYKKKNIQ